MLIELFSEPLICVSLLPCHLKVNNIYITAGAGDRVFVFHFLGAWSVDLGDSSTLFLFLCLPFARSLNTPVGTRVKEDYSWKRNWISKCNHVSHVKTNPKNICTCEKKKPKGVRRNWFMLRNNMRPIMSPSRFEEAHGKISAEYENGKKKKKK